MTDFLKSILWATDFSDESKGALSYAKMMAGTFGAQLTALHVIPDFSPSLYDTLPGACGELAEKIAKVKEEATSRMEEIGKAEGIAFSKILVKHGTKADVIVDVAKTEKMDLIVIGRQGTSGIPFGQMGRVANRVLRSSSVPVLVTKQKNGGSPIKKILVPTDFSEQEEIERDFAWNLAKGFQASLGFLYVLELYGHDFRVADEMFDSVLKRLRAMKKKEGEDILFTEDVTRAVYASEGIIDYSETNAYDLIVMSTQVRKIARFFLGSTTEKVISHGAVPVFAIPPERD